MPEPDWISDSEVLALEADAEEAERRRIDAIRLGRSNTNDVDAADELVRWMIGTMTDVATGELSIDDVNDDYNERYRALRAVLGRLDIEHPNPHSDLWVFLGARIRKLTDAAVRLAEGIKHNPNADRIEAGIAADAAIEVVNIARRIAQLESSA